MGKTFRFCKASVFPFSSQFSWKHSSAMIPTNLSHLGLVRQIHTATSALLQALFYLLFPHFLSPTLSQFCSAFAPCWCAFRGKGLSISLPTCKMPCTGALAARSPGWSHQERAGWDFAHYIPLSLQLWKQRPVCKLQMPVCCAATHLLSEGRLSAAEQLNSQLLAKFSHSYTTHKHCFVPWALFAQR